MGGGSLLCARAGRLVPALLLPGMIRCRTPCHEDTFVFMQSGYENVRVLVKTFVHVQLPIQADPL